MNKYIGVKIVEARPLNKYEFYMNIKGLDCKDDNEEGYLVIYPDGYESWCPKKQFEEANRLCSASQGVTLVQWPDGPMQEIEDDALEGAIHIEGATVVPLMTFGHAIEALKNGLTVARKGWNGKDMFVFMRPADSIPAQVVVENVKSIPDVVKQHIADKFKGDYKQASNGSPFTINFTAYLCMKAADGTIVNGWLASQTDMLAEDWVILD
jgi:hypothetical protein